MLGVSLTTVQIWVESGVLKAWKTAGGHRRVSRASVEAVLREQARSLAGDEEAPAEREKVVVVVEDDALQREIYRLKFAEWQLPAKLVLANDGFEGLMEIGANQPVLTIADLDMPGMDGFEMVRRLRERSQPGGMRVVVVTALTPDVIAERGGLPDDVMVFYKPIPFAELGDILRTVVTA